MSTNSNLTIWGQEGAKFSNLDTDVVVSGLTAYAAGDYVLVNVSVNANDVWYKNTAKAYVDLYTANTKIYNNETKSTGKTVLATNETWPTLTQETIADVYVVDVQKAGTIESGKYTGRSLPDIDEIVINGEKVKTNCTFTLDEHGMGERVLTEDVLDFFVDQYGYAIGDLKPTSTSAYAVVDGIVWITDGKTYSDKQTASAGVIMAGGEAVTDVTVSKVGFAGAAEIATTGREDGQGIPSQATVSTVKANNAYYNSSNHNNMHAVVKYAVDANGNYTLYYNETNVYNLCGAATVVSATNPNLGRGTNYYGVTEVIRADEKTVFTVKTIVGGAAKYTSYTGIANVPTIKSANAVVAVQENDAKYASFIYVDATNAIFAGSTAVAFVTEDHRANFEDTTTRLSYYNVYINGEKTTVEVDKTLASTPVDIDRDIFKAGPGLYKLEFNNEGKVVAVTPISLTGADGYYTGVIASTSDVVVTLDAANPALENIGDTINHTGATIYVVNYDNSYATGAPVFARYTGVSVGSAADLAKGATITYKMVAGSSWMAVTIYVFVANN